MTFFILLVTFLVVGWSIVPFSESQTDPNDAAVMLALKKTLNPPPDLGWTDPDPCKWTHVSCSQNKRVTRIQVGQQNLQGTLPPNLSKLAELERLEFMFNNISGPVPSLSGLSSLQVLMLGNNQFSSIPDDIFTKMNSLQSVNIDNNPFAAWEIPESLRNASTLQNFSANNAGITGKIPEFLGSGEFPGLISLHLAFNSLEGELPGSFSGLIMESFWVNGQKGGKLGGGVGIIQNMTSLKQVWLHSNHFLGPLPDFSGLKVLEDVNLRDNSFTGPVPVSLVKLGSLRNVNLTNNMLQGPMPKFGNSVTVDMTKGTNSFCLPQPHECDPRVTTLLLIVESMGYPTKFADNWKGNDPCAAWFGITCNNGNVTIVNFQKMGLSGMISPKFAALKSLQRLILADNNLTGTIPEELTTLHALTLLDVSNNHIHGNVPAFNTNMIVKTNGNIDIGKDKGHPTSPGQAPSGSGSQNDGNSKNRDNESKRLIGIIIGPIIGAVFFMVLIGFAAFYFCKNKQKGFSGVQSPNAMVVNPHHSGSDNQSLKITVAGSSVPASEAGAHIQMVEAGNIIISSQVLKNVTDNFSDEKILGKGGFGTVYKGELHDGTMIAVKRMESGLITGKGLTEFTSEIAVLTKVRHRHLVALLGYCLDGNERLFLYEYMPQGTLSRHLFNWAHEGLKPLEWTRRLTIALDVARGVEYLHGLAQQSFIHRDLKPSNILLGFDMRAKVSDFGLVRLAPEGKGSIETRVAGTFGYLAPEYAVTGRVTTKGDVFSFGVILMELITGRKALDERQPEESMHLATWFRRMLINKDTFRKAIDPALDLTEETLASISTTAELAGHCCAREPYQRPDMGHAVNVLSSLVEVWRPTEQTSEDIYGIDLDMSLPQALTRWQSFEGTSHVDSSSSSSFMASLDNNNSSMSIPSRPFGFADSFTSTDGR